MSTIKGIDCSTIISDSVAAELVRLGYGFVCRYLVPIAYASKRLTAHEAKIISDAGLDILCVFETTASRALGGAANGAADGAAAFIEAQMMNMPTTGYIYFAVDFDAAAKDMPAIEQYLKAAKGQAGSYKIGVYGSYSVIEAMAKSGACDGFWQTYAWSKGLKSGNTLVYQYLNGQTAAGLSVDFDEAYSDAGMWNYNTNTQSNLNMTIDEARTELTALAGTGSAHSAWADQAITTLVKAGVFNGDGSGNYGWGQCITREAMATILYNMIQKLGLLDNLK